MSSNLTTKRPPLNAELGRLISSMEVAGVRDVPLMCVLGSGLGAFAERLEERHAVSYSELEGMPKSTVPGHAGQLILGTLEGRRVVVQQGRVHLYEGHDPGAVTRCVRAFAALGGRALLLTNAAGGLNPAWPPGTLMRITDHINLSGATPLVESEAGFGRPWDESLGAIVDRAAKDSGVKLERGVYAANLGPQYETPAEVRYAGKIGADAVGMSTALEALAGHAEGLRVAGISCITNPAAGLSPEKLRHEDVVAAGKQAANDFCKLLEKAVPAVVDSLG